MKIIKAINETQNGDVVLVTEIGSYLVNDTKTFYVSQLEVVHLAAAS